MLAKKLFSLSINFKSVIFLPKRNVINRIHSIQSTAAEIKRLTHHNFESDEVTRSNLPIIPAPSEVIQLLDNKEKLVSGQQIVKAMKSILQLSNEERILTKVLRDQDFFVDTCICTNLNVEKLELFEAIEILKILQKLDIPTSSAVVLSLLKKINNSISIDTSLENFNTIAKLLKLLKPVSSVRNVLKSMNKIFLQKISKSFNPDSFEYLISALQYSSYNFSDSGVLRIIFKALQNIDYNHVDATSLVTLMRILSEMKRYPTGFLGVLQETQNALANKVDELSINDIEFLFRRIASKIGPSYRDDKFYNTNLIDVCVEKLIDNDIDFSLGASCLGSLNVMRYTHKNFLSYLSAKLYEDKQISHKIIPFEMERMLKLLTGLAFLKYKPIFLDELLKIMQNKRLLNLSNETLIIYSLHLVCLDLYDSAALNKIFNSDHDFQQNIFLHWSFLKLYQKLKTMPNYDGPLPLDKHIKSFELLQYVKEYPMLDTLTQAVGGPMYIKTNLKSKLHHQIDHAIVYRNGEYPVAINEIKNNANSDGIDKSIQYIEDLIVPANCQVILIQMVQSSWYARNTTKLLGPFEIFFDTLEALSYKVVKVNEKEWYKMTDTTRIPFIMNLIKTRLELNELDEK